MDRPRQAPSVLAWLVAIALGSGWCTGAARAGQTDVTQIDIDELMNVNVSIASKKPEPFARIPAAVYVIRADDLRRGGVFTLAEALRMVPGFHVERRRANTWSISARGFHGDNANKLLVLRDGRTVYSNLQSGVFWDVQDMLLDNVDRIEVVRGPGGTLWGTNAVNGVINVISKPAQDSPGAMLKLGAGRELRALAAGRYGFALDEEHHVRISGKVLALDGAAERMDSHDKAHDALTLRRADFRSDWARGEDRLRVQGELYDGSSKTLQSAVSLLVPGRALNRDNSDLRGGHLIGEWSRSLAADSSLDVRTYYDYVSRLNKSFEDRLHTGDLELQYRFAPRPTHDLVVGAGYRLLLSDLEDSFAARLEPERRLDDIVSLFAQDEIALRDDLWLTLGVRLEHNDYTRWEVLPSARLAFAVDEHSTAWLAASRSVRTPSLLDSEFRINSQTLFSGMTPVLFSVFGTEHFRPEQLFALESGYRTRPLDRLSLDLALFANFYDDLRAFSQGPIFVETSPLPLHGVLPFFIVNESRARSYGAELAADVELTPWWMLRASWTHLSVNIHKTKRIDDDTATADDQDEGFTPRNQLWLRSSMHLPYNLSLDLTTRYVGSLQVTRVKRYTEADLRIGWLSPSGLELAVVGRNLLHSERVEYPSTAASAIERDVYVEVTWRPR